MLESLSIKNIALIDSCNIEFNKGLNILSGETGAGKSIILDSLGFILGSRADKTLIRHGENVALVNGVFDITNNAAAKNALENIGIDVDDELIISREMTIDGKNTCRVNGEKVTLSMLKTVTKSLVDIYGQHDSNRLFNEDEHIEILDDFIGNAILPIKNKLNENYLKLKDIKNSLDRIGSMKDVYKKLDILSYEINEIKTANLEIDEEEELNRLSNKYANVESILEGLNNAYAILQGDDNESNVLSSLECTSRSLAPIVEYDKEIEDLHDQLSTSIDELSSIARSVSRLAESVEYDPYDAKRVEDRLDEINSLKRKYGNSIEEILTYLEKIENEYDEYSNMEEHLDKLNAELSIIKKELYDNAIELSNLRKKCAKTLEKDIIANLNELGMKNSKFIISFESSANCAEEADKITPNNGIDSVSFLISANLGQEPRPLSKIISGGELSRFMLALKNIMAGTDDVDTMVFDEIDSGISGNIASIVAKKLYQTSKERQVLAVTHLPQLSAMSDSHYLIEKGVVGKTTKTSIKLLDRDNKILEVARLMGGDASELSIAHATTLVDAADEFKRI